MQFWITVVHKIINWIVEINVIIIKSIQLASDIKGTTHTKHMTNKPRMSKCEICSMIASKTICQGSNPCIDAEKRNN